MSSRVLALAALLALPSPAGAQESPPAIPQTGTVEGTLPPAFSLLDGVTALLTAPRTVAGPVPLTLTLNSSLTVPVTFAAARDNDQNCAAAPTVRVLRVGTREVVYPVPGASPRICTQDLLGKTAPARGNAVFTRTLDLPAGDYMIEGWFAGFGNDLRVKVPAQPVRVTVR
ncbi:hypothetical protein DEIPH_ctg079orf0010 [Deinococcus phoenicis]|uniref:Lipoprotein n=1 Tax=Deinococcus phoenicis TaxID=1476583 RepID=A0A016QKY3_9DEIO|nr:hypothetical protein [Deinococcus phoenicis]EYB66631.1 hypothetical protein DEIPH_ctg079orf0010 [Deinococcus phoenicis]